MEGASLSPTLSDCPPLGTPDLRAKKLRKGAMLEQNWRFCDLETVDHGEIDNISPPWDETDGEQWSDHRREGNERIHAGHMTRRVRL